MKTNGKSKVCVGILAAVITSIVFVANTGFTKTLAQTPTPNQGTTSSNATSEKMPNMSMPAPMCTTTKVPIPTVSLNKTYSIPQGFKGNPTAANGKCVVTHQMGPKASPRPTNYETI